jgi:ribonuclease HI
VFPRWHSKAYMNMFGHPNVRHIVTFEAHSFAFIPPDGLDTQGWGAARWPVVVFEVSNAGGRRKFGRGDARRIAREGESLGARVFEGRDEAFVNWSRGLGVRDHGPRVSGQAGKPRRREYPPVVTPDWVIEEHPPVLAHLGDGLQLYTDGSKIQGEVGAGLFDETNEVRRTMKVRGPQTVNRAELVGILAALQYAGGEPAVVYTDSKFALQAIRRWILKPSVNDADKHADVVSEICSVLATRRVGVRTRLLKVPAHTGLRGNEVADGLAKAAALNRSDPHTNPEVGPPPSPPQRFDLTLATQVEGNLKDQLRELVVDWLSSEYQLGQVYHGIWTDPSWLETLDADASTWMWRYGGDVPRAQLVHPIRMRMGEFVCNYWLHKRNLSDTKACPLCAYHTDNWAHTASGLCAFSQPHPRTGQPHRPLGDLATTRHNAACRVVASAIANGAKGKNLIHYNFGKGDEGVERPSVPKWMADTLPGFDTTTMKPDFLMLEGWPATVAPPTRPMVNRGGTSVRVVLADLTFTMDDGPARWTEARERKQKYKVLLDAMKAAGWRVDEEVRVIMVGHRAILPASNHGDLAGMGVCQSGIRDVQRKLHKVAAEYLASMVRLTRRLRERAGRRARQPG